MDTKEILKFVYKIVQIMNGIIHIFKALHEIKDQKKENHLYIRKRANVYQTLTRNDSEKEIPPSDSDKINITIQDNENCNITINVSHDKE